MKRISFLLFVLPHVFFLKNGIYCSNYPIVEYYTFGDIQYVLFSQRVTWEEANMLCTTYDSKLAVPDNMEKASNIAKTMAESNIVMEDAWLGARRFDSLWVWIDDMNSTSNRKIPMQSDIEHFPPWSREPSRLTKECLAIDRKSHSYPNFIDLDCRLLRPFVCERKPGNSMNKPVPAKWIQIKKSTYVLYHGRVTWSEAVTFCRSQGMRLAIMKNQDIINTLSNGMIKSRPDFESVWIGARFSHGHWMWLSTGSILNTMRDESGYPPWRFGKPEKNAGCLVLDRHLEHKPNFIEMLCDRKRDFICEEYPTEDLEEWMNEPMEFQKDNKTYVIYPTDKTWDESRLYCQERGSILASIDDLSEAQLLVDVMGDHPKEISHVWLGGLYHSTRNQWRWIHDDNIIPLSTNDTGFPPWVEDVVESDSNMEESLCLNLDRSEHTKPHLYGLTCKSKQAFVCSKSCDIPPSVDNGNWSCRDNNSSIKACSLKCHDGYIAMGLKDVYCSSNTSWYNKPNWLEYPLCLDAKDYAIRIVRSLSQELQKVSGYYVLLSHFQENIQSLSVEFLEGLLNIFPINKNLRAGFTSYISEPIINISLEENTLCSTLELVSSMKNKVVESKKLTENVTYSDSLEDILKKNFRRILIIAVIDSERVFQNQKVFEQLRLDGHYVTTIGLRNDWKSLLPITTIGFQQRLNLFLFDDEEEFRMVIKELKNTKSVVNKCSQNKNLTSNIDDSTTLEPIVEISQENISATVKTTAEMDD